jgi:hypothetical protein
MAGIRRSHLGHEYGEWHTSNVENETLRPAFQQACDMMLDNGLVLEQAGLQGPGPKSLH